MSTAARIDELRNKFEENPRRYFASLANELRRAGSLSEAIALSRAFLLEQPDHMSGHIVFGEVLYAVGDLSEARSVFEQALALDPENQKALRHLGDIAKRGGDTAGARRWYERVLEADPWNDGIAAQLATLARPENVAPVVPGPSALRAAAGVGEAGANEAGANEAGANEASAMAYQAPAPELLDLDAIEAAGENGRDDLPKPVAAPSAEQSADEVDDDPFGFAGEGSDLVPDLDSDAGAEVLPFAWGLIAPEWSDTSELLARVSVPGSVTPAFVATLSSDAVAAFGVEPGEVLPTAAIEPDGAFAFEITTDLEPSRWALAEPAVKPGGNVGGEPVADIEDIVEPSLDAAESAPEPDSVEASVADAMQQEQHPAFVTETMGELLVSQGFTARAISVYTALVGRRPHDLALTSRLAELVERLAEESARVAGAVPTPAVSRRVAPLFSPPSTATSMSSPGFEESTFEEGPIARLTARERFAELAARRVPQRTHPRASVAVDTSADSLASLFGGGASVSESAAARALADAFGSSDGTSHSGGDQPVEHTVLRGAPRFPIPTSSAMPVVAASVSAGTGEPSAVDRFVAGPATRQVPHHPPAELLVNSSRPSVSATVRSGPSHAVAPHTESDDLARFSGWLRGLGKT
jgi:hypothetical protein